MTDPYRLLGVEKNASDDEIRKAYKDLAIKYDPSQYEDSQLKEFASEKMRDVTTAYDKIMDERKSTKINDNTVPNETFENHNSSFSDVRKLIMEGRITDAEQILNGVPISLRDAEWYFLKGSILYKKGWLEEAYKNLSEACRMNPKNREYAAALNQVINYRQGKFGNAKTSPDPVGCGCSACDVCTSLICADCCCECIGGDLFRCC